MKFIDLEGKGMLIALALIIFISGALMFYFQKRFVMLENSIIQQGKILQSFIIKSNATQISEPMQQYSEQYNEKDEPQYLASEIAIHSAQEQINNASTKIDVSDDSDSENDSDSDSENDSDSDSDYDSEHDSEHDSDSETTDNNVTNVTNKTITLSLMTNDLNIELIEDSIIEDNTIVNKLNILNMNEVNMNEVNMNEVNMNANSSIFHDSLIVEPSSQVNLKDIFDNTTLMLENEITDASLDKIKNMDELNTIKKMKVSELREMVLDKGLVDDQDNANKMKKEQLLKILQQ